MDTRRAARFFLFASLSLGSATCSDSARDDDFHADGDRADADEARDPASHWQDQRAYPTGSRADVYGLALDWWRDHEPRDAALWRPLGPSPLDHTAVTPASSPSSGRATAI